MKLKEKILNKIKATANGVYKKAAPIVEKKIQTTVENGKDNIICSILDGVEIVALSVIILSVVLKPSDILRSSAMDCPRNVYNVYNEVHVTNNYYSKGEN